MFGYSPYAGGYGYSPAYSYSPAYTYAPAYVDPYETQMRREALARQRARQALAAEQQARKALAEQQARKALAERAAARRRSTPVYGFYDPTDDETDSFVFDPYAQRRRELEQARRLQEIYRRAAREDDDVMEEDEDEEEEPSEDVQPAPTVQAQSRSESIPVNIRASSPAASPRSSPPPKSSSRPSSPASQPQPQSYSAPQSQPEREPVVEPTQAAHTAASAIQRAWRRHAALTHLADIHRRFTEAGSAFSAPDVLEYTIRDMRATDDGREETTAVNAEPVPFTSFVRRRRTEESGDEEEGNAEVEEEKVPPLAYTKCTFSVHALNEQYMRLLNELDAVPSWGDREVRERRRALAREIEDEAGRVEEWWKAVWKAEHAAIVKAE